MGKNSEKGVIPIIALVAILAAAGVVAFIYYKNTYQKTITPVSQESQIPLTIESPVEGAVITSGKVLIKGKTSPSTTVVFYTEEQENSVESNTFGNFEGEIGLQDGINSITVTAFAENGGEKSLTLDIVNDTK